MQSQLLNGAKCTISMNGAQVAAAFVADYSLETMAQEIETIDSVFPAEIAPTRIRVSMNLRVYRSPDNDPIQDGYISSASALGQTEQTAFLSGKYLYIEIKDNLDNTILVIPKAWIVRRTGSMSAGDFLTENWSIIGRGYYGPAK